jgi:glycosyltransferase involved in cell wall biosynthesis
LGGLRRRGAARLRRRHRPQGQPVKIAVDARELCGKPTGVGRYLFELLQEWSDGPERRRHAWTLYAHDTPHVPAGFSDRVCIVPGHGGTRWEQWDLARRLRRDRPDVLFAPAYTAPLAAPCPTVVTIHDVSFFAQPDRFRWREGLRRRRVTALAARRARIVLTVSEFSRREIARHTGVPLDAIRVVHHGMRLPAAPPPTRRRPLVLYAGSIFPRRHVDLLIAAFGGTVAGRLPEARLEIVGENRLPDPAAVEGWLAAMPPGARERVACRSWVDDDTLQRLYSEAAVFAFLSDYEGFGLTPLEALAAGVPVVVLDTPVAREIYGEAARYIADATAPEPLGAALMELLTDEAARQARLAAAPGVLARYRWDVAAAATLDAITGAAGD